jgi:hypothetical protein
MRSRSQTHDFARYWVKVAVFPTTLFMLLIFSIRAQPYLDRVAPALKNEDCPAPCFIRIRPGVATLQEAVYRLEAHEWVANTRDDFPALVRDAVYFDAGIPRTIIHWQWSATLPDWIDGTQQASLTVEDREVLDVVIDTRFLLGEIWLAFGDPDETLFRRDQHQFEYAAWYNDEKILVHTQGRCPAWHFYHATVQITFLPDAPQFEDATSPLC